MRISHPLSHPMLGRVPSRGRRPTLVERLAGAWKQWRTWQARAAERAQLATLDARALRDIGITPSEAQREVRKPFWKS